MNFYPHVQSKSSSTRRTWATPSLGSLKPILIAMLAGMGSLAAHAGTCNVTTPGAATCAIPAGVTSVNVVATGAGGGGGGGTTGGHGGAGGIVTQTLSGLGGTTLSLFVGGGGVSNGGGGGGAASTVNVGTSSQIIAGGGGGGGGFTVSGTANGGNGGNGNSQGGGASGTPGGGGGGGGAGGTGGSAGTSNIGGTGNHGGSGNGGSGGTAGFSGGGGVGSGGGNGGGGSGSCSGPSVVGYAFGGGGGGGFGGGGGGGLGVAANVCFVAGGGGGGSTGGTVSVASNGGAVSSNGGNGSIVVTWADIVPPITPLTGVPSVPGIATQLAPLDLSANQGPAMTACLLATVRSMFGGDTVYVGQDPSGVAKFLQGGHTISFYPLQASTATKVPAGIIIGDSNVLAVGTSCGDFTIVPALSNVSDFGSLMTAMGLQANINAQGVMTVTAGSTTYVFRPDYLVANGTAGKPSLTMGADGLYRFTDSAGNVQILRPAFVDTGDLGAEASTALSTNGSIAILTDGTALFTAINGQQFVLTPDLTLTAATAANAAKLWWQDLANHYLVRSSLLTQAQGFTLQARN